MEVENRTKFLLVLSGLNSKSVPMTQPIASHDTVTVPDDLWALYKADCATIKAWLDSGWLKTSESKALDTTEMRASEAVEAIEQCTNIGALHVCQQLDARKIVNVAIEERLEKLGKASSN